MKATLTVYVRSLAVLFALTLLFSLVFSALYYFHVTSATIFHACNWIGGLLAFGAGGAMLGLGVSKKALFHALPVVVVLWLPSFLLSGVSLLSIVEILSKSIAYLLMCLLFYQKHHKA